MDQLYNGEVLAIVGSSYDITGTVINQTRMNDSNPSHISFACGGAGRNVAENLARMSLRVGIISAYGTDAFSKELLETNQRVGMDISRSYIKEGGPPCVYISLLDRHGELLLAAADMKLMESMPPEYIDENADYINHFPLIFVDTNNSEETLKRIASVATRSAQSDGRIFADTVSMEKAVRLLPILDHLDTIKTNRGELEVLSGYCVKSMDEIRKAMESLLEKGVKRLFVTLGADGSCCCDNDGFYSLRSFPAEVKSVTGAGDAFAAALTFGTLRGFTNEEILFLGSAASHITLESLTAVSTDMNEDLLMTVYNQFRKEL